MNCRIVAEIGANHNGTIERALALVGAAATAGADAIKIQTFTPAQMADADTVLTKGPWVGRRLLDLYQETCTHRQWIPKILQAARDEGMEAFSSVFHPDDVDYLETLGCSRYKIASFELTDTVLIAHAARTRKPIIISTGMATEPEILRASIAADPSPHLTLLKCTSAYPADPKHANLATMQRLGSFPRCKAFGLSDHTPGIGVAVAAVALGASMVEKHLTLRRADGGPDAEFSMEPHEFKHLVTECRRAWEAIGRAGMYGPVISEAASLPLRRPPGGMRGISKQS